MKYLIIAQPKAGIHLCESLCRRIGLQNSGLHIFQDRYVKRDFQNKDWGKNALLEIKSNFNDSVKLIKDNHFAITQSLPVQSNVSAVLDYKKILLTRDTNSIVESSKRFNATTGVNLNTVIDSSMLAKYYDWDLTENIFHIRFSHLINKRVDIIDKLQLFLYNDIKYDSELAINSALRKDTLTKSSIRN